MITRASRVVLVLLLLFASLTASFANSAKDKLAAGHIDEAIAELNGRLSSSPADAESSNLLCRAYFTLEEWDRAESSCRKAVSLDPANSLFHLWLGRVYGEKADRVNFISAASLAGKVRGEFEPIATSAPGVSISDHLPLLSRHADKYTIVRSVTHTNGDHISQCHDMLTGNAYPKVTPIISAARSDHPHFGAVLARLQPRQNGLPACVQLPCTLASNSGKIIPGQHAGFLGQSYDPYLIEACPNKLAVEDPDFRNFSAADIRLPESVSPNRLEQRQFHVVVGRALAVLLQRSIVFRVIPVRRA